MATNRQTDRPADKESYRGAMHAPKNQLGVSYTQDKTASEK
jgi:hypothetical protein